MVALRCKDSITPFCFASCICCLIELAQGPATHDTGIDYLACLEWCLVLEYGGLAVSTDKFDPEATRLGNRNGFFAAIKITGVHMSHMGFRIGAPGAHLVRMFTGELFDRSRRAAIRVAFPQYGVDGAANDLAVARLDVFFCIRFGIFGIVRDLVTQRLQFLDCRFQLWRRCTDVRQLDDVGFGPKSQLTQFGQLISYALARSQIFGKVRDDSACKGNIFCFNDNTRCLGECLNDRKQGVCCQPRRFINLGPINLWCCHDFSSYITILAHNYQSACWLANKESSRNVNVVFTFIPSKLTLNSRLRCGQMRYDRNLLILTQNTLIVTPIDHV